MLKTAYFNSVVDKGITYSIDMVRLKFKINNAEMVSKIMNAMRDKSIYECPTPFEFEYVERKKWYLYRHNFTITLPTCDDYGEIVGYKRSFYIAFSLNSDDKTKVCEGVLEFNPNKCHGQAMEWLIGTIRTNSKYIEILRYDLACDIPVVRSSVHMIKDNRHAKLEMPSSDRDTWTEYLGKHNHSGFCKVYNKKIESNLDYTLTRFEITSEHVSYNDFIKQVPTVVVKGNLSLMPYVNLKGTDLVLYELLKDSDSMDSFFKRLGRDKQKKLKEYLYNDTEDYSITVPSAVFYELMGKLKTYCKVHTINTL